MNQLSEFVSAVSNCDIHPAGGCCFICFGMLFLDKDISVYMYPSSEVIIEPLGALQPASIILHE